MQAARNSEQERAMQSPRSFQMEETECRLLQETIFQAETAGEKGNRGESQGYGREFRFCDSEEKTMEEILKVKYHSKEIEKLRYIAGKSDWVDLRSSENVTLKKGEFRLICLGISVEIPKGYEMLVAPRSSTFRNFGLIQTNSLGIVDESYCGDNDLLYMPVMAVRDTEVHVNDRICQFRLLKHQPELRFEEVESLGNQDRGGFGSTGLQ